MGKKNKKNVITVKQQYKMMHSADYQNKLEGIVAPFGKTVRNTVHKSEKNYSRKREKRVSSVELGSFYFNKTCIFHTKRWFFYFFCYNKNMKIYINIIIIGAFMLLIFPFLGLPEFWQSLYVILIAFAIGFSSMVIRYKSGIVKDLDDESSLKDYIEELRTKFNDSKTHHDE